MNYSNTENMFYQTVNPVEIVISLKWKNDRSVIFAVCSLMVARTYHLFSENV